MTDDLHEGDELLRELAKDIPWDRPDDARRDALRSSLLSAVADTPPHPPDRRWLVTGATFAAGALCAAAVAVVIVRTRGERPNDHPIAFASSPAQITAVAASRIEHQLVATTTGVDEMVRIHDGTVRLAVDESRRGDHVRVRTRDAEVEGAGDYEVVVASEALSAVTVRSGTAQIVVDGRPPVFLAAGQTWHAAVITADLLAPTALDVRYPDIPAHASPVPDRSPAPDAAQAPATSDPRTSAPHAVRMPDAVPERSTERSTERPTTPSEIRIAPTEVVQTSEPRMEAPGSGAASTRPARTEVEKHFAAGWRLLREGKAKEAAVELAAAADPSPGAGPEEPLAADARYFQAIALVRAGQGRDAEKVLVAFLDHAPHSLRRGRAAVLLGRLIAERGDVESARSWYRSAVDDPDAGVAGAARAGLDALPARR